MNYSICIAYGYNDSNLILFSVGFNTSLVRQLLIDNLTRNEIRFTDNGASILVNSDQFSSTDDIAERALSGFTKIDYKGLDRYDRTGTITGYMYEDVLPFFRGREEKKYRHQIIECSRSDKPDSQGIIISLKQNIKNLKENSEDILKSYYAGLHPTMRI